MEEACFDIIQKKIFMKTFLHLFSLLLDEKAYQTLQSAQDDPLRSAHLPVRRHNVTSNDVETNATFSIKVI